MAGEITVELSQVVTRSYAVFGRGGATRQGFEHLWMWPDRWAHHLGTSMAWALFSSAWCLLCLSDVETMKEFMGECISDEWLALSYDVTWVFTIISYEDVTGKEIGPDAFVGETHSWALKDRHNLGFLWDLTWSLKPWIADVTRNSFFCLFLLNLKTPPILGCGHSFLTFRARCVTLHLTSAHPK